MWPTELPQFSRDVRERSQLQVVDLVPERWEELLLWLQVTRLNGGPDHFRQYAVIHTQACTNNLTEITIRVQGFLKSSIR